MSIVIRPLSGRGHFKNHWLDSWHTFSFGEYHDSAHMGFSDLRVLNQDTVENGYGFPMHRHRDMEIVSWVLEGKLRHEDSMGHVSVVGAGGTQRLSAGSGMAHGEFNAQEGARLHFMQIWVLPRTTGEKPSYEDKEYSPEALAADWVCIAAPEGEKGATILNQDCRIYVTRLAAGASRTKELELGRQAWVHLARGRASLNGSLLEAGDGASVTGETRLHWEASQDSEILVFSLR